MRPPLRSVPKFLQGGAILPRPVLWVIAGLSVGAGVLGFATGRSVAEMTETEAITVYAHIYAQETGGALTDCAAVPGTGAVWLVVHCGAGATQRSYRVGRDGTLVWANDGPSA